MIVVMADDFSGAAEIAGIAYQCGLSAEVQTEFAPSQADCVVVDSNTRSLSPRLAADRASEIAEAIREARPSLFFKKIDSILRGPVAAETWAIAETFGKARVLLANANPSLGRTVVHSSLRIDHVPIDQTSFANDPEHPRTSGNVYELLGFGRPPTGTLPTRDSSNSMPPMDRFEVPDVASVADLEALAGRASEEMLWCGAADFFRVLLLSRGGLKPIRPWASFQTFPGTLLACGSAGGSLHAEDVCDTWTIFDVADPDVASDLVCDQLSAGNSVGLKATQSGANQSHEETMNRLARVTDEVLDRVEIRDLLIEGGRTASTIVRVRGWKRLPVSAAYADGVVGLQPREMPEMRLVVKPGSYPWPNGEEAIGAKRLAPVLSRRVSALLLILTCFLISAQQAIATTFDESIRPILEYHCNDCHGMPDEGPEGDFSLAQYTSRDSVLAAKQAWKKVLDVVEGYEMPPADAEDLLDEDRVRLVRWIRQALAEPEFGDQVNPGKPVLRHLTRLEYNNTVRDLLGLETDVFMFSERLPYDKGYFDPSSDKMPERLRIGAREYGAKYPVLLPEVGLPGDTRAEHGFSNRGDAQSLGTVSLDQYVQIAEQIAFHEELLSRGEWLQEIFPNASFRTVSASDSSKPTASQVVGTVSQLAPNHNVSKTAPGSALSLEAFRERLARAFEEDRGGVYDVSENANTTIAGKGGVLHLAFGENANRSVGVNPSEDIWNAAFATAEESSGGALFTNRVKGKKQFLFGFQRSGDTPWKGISELGIVVLSRRDQSGLVQVIAEFDGDASAMVSVNLKEGAGVDNTFVSFAAPEGSSIKRLRIDGSDFSGDYVLLDDLAFITRDKPSDAAEVVGREKPADGTRELPPATESGPGAKSNSQRGITVDTSIARKAPRERVAHFMKRAYRRRPTPDEIDLYWGLYRQVRSEGADDERAMRTVLQGILSSPGFLYLVERGESEQGQSEQRHSQLGNRVGEVSSIRPLTDHELACRLSYFLWSSMPDVELTTLADRGVLSDPAVIDGQVRRMLKDARVRELSENFFVEWLHLRELWSAQPDARRFADYYDGPKGKRTLARDMFCEPLVLFETILTENRSILELVESDYTYVNDRLAKLYQIDAAVDSDQDWQRVSLRDDRPSDAVRGGVLTSAAVLTLTSFPHRTSPIRRGAWFLETVFNRPPPPPKIAVADIDEQEKVDHLTLREKVELHRANAACAVCHDRIDPPGFAFETFDAIGRWRDHDGDEPIDPSGSLRGLGAFANAVEFKQQIVSDKERFVRGFVEHLLSYALARELEYYDQAAVDQILRNAAADDYRLGRIIAEIAVSHPFRNIHGEASHDQ